MNLVLSAEPTASAPAVLLRPWRAEDAASLAAAHRDPLMRDQLTTPLADQADAAQWIRDQDAAWANRTRLSFAVLQDAPTGRLVGHVVLKKTSASSAEVGYWTSAETRGQGIAPRALEAVSRWAFGEQRVMPLTRLDLLHAIDNHASCRVAEKCHYPLNSLLPARPPQLPARHLHTRTCSNA
ncbi:GNAT family N-acetyltransferase [Actinomadura rupiterrae]|uniref:GNAT family N-acetyltransferase n=1 Tax=Actinomadura rupiterrae TaxID=559627 RepID=UPI0020A4F3FA|nr:GNAT family protein [Actinomadura rupiterrae]MCP2343193.1 RimJ/RimL family protein N-acetyltransferase [Actinomadura rupiterrae]